MLVRAYFEARRSRNGTTLSIVAVVVLRALIVMSVKRRRDMQASQKAAVAGVARVMVEFTR
jgi:hypothetical protein